MERKKTVMDFAGGVLCTFGFVSIMMMVFTFLLGESAKELSTMFRLGSRGIPVETLLQYLLLSILITGIRYFFCWEKIGRYISEVWADILTISGILLVIVLFIIGFGWFPLHMWQPWALFALCFVICFVVSLWIMMEKTKIENKMLEENLESLKARWEEERNGKCS